MKPLGRSVVVDGEWIAVQLQIHEPEAARYLSSMGESARDDAVETALRLGLRALASADQTYTERLLDQKLEAIVGQLMAAAEASLGRATTAFHERWTKAVDDGLATRLAAHQLGLQGSLDRLFSSDRTTSVQADVRRFLTQYHAQVSVELAAYHAKLSTEVGASLRETGNPDHPLARMREEVGSLRKEIAVLLKAAEMAASAGTIKKELPREGLNYQDAVHKAIATLLAPSADEVELFGRRPGATGGADGDMVITLDPRVGGGTPVRIAVEVTREANLTVRKLKAMLAKARLDRVAQAAVIVIERGGVLGGQLLADYPGLGVVAVYEPDAPVEVGTLPLRIALKQARVMALQEVRQPVTERNDARISAEISKARSSLELIDRIIGGHTQIGKVLDGTTSAAKDLRRRVLDALAEIDACLSEVGSEGSAT